MIMYSVRARIIGNPVEATSWAHEVAQVASKAGGMEVQVAARIGAGQDIIWVSQHDNMADLDAKLQKIQNDSKYQSMVKTAVERHLLEPGFTEAAIWRTL